MNRKDVHQRLLSERWFRPLSAEEEAEKERLLASSGRFRREWELDSAIRKGLSELPDTPLPAGFARRVMGRIAAERAAGASSSPWSVLRAFLSRPAWAFSLPALALACGLFLLQPRNPEQKLAENLSEAVKVRLAPSLEELRHFDEIRRLGQVASGVDWDLISVADFPSSP